jgi:hypothetical protein
LGGVSQYLLPQAGGCIQRTEGQNSCKPDGTPAIPAAIGIAAGLTMLAGAVLYLRDSGGLQLAWITSNVGLGFTIGALAAVAGSIEGGAVLGPTGEKLGKLSAEIQTQGKPPTPEQQAELAKLNAKMNSGGLLSTILLTIALLAMATARYW